MDPPRWSRDGPAGVHGALRGQQVPQAETKESHLSGERCVAERGQAVLLLKQTLPVRLQRRGARSVLAVQVRVQDVDGLLVHRGLKLAGEERRTG